MGRVCRLRQRRALTSPSRCSQSASAALSHPSSLLVAGCALRPHVLPSGPSDSQPGRPPSAVCVCVGATPLGGSAPRRESRSLHRLTTSLKQTRLRDVGLGLTPQILARLEQGLAEDGSAGTITPENRQGRWPLAEGPSGPSEVRRLSPPRSLSPQSTLRPCSRARARSLLVGDQAPCSVLSTLKSETRPKELGGWSHRTRCLQDNELPRCGGRGAGEGPGPGWAPAAQGQPVAGGHVQLRRGARVQSLAGGLACVWRPLSCDVLRGGG